MFYNVHRFQVYFITSYSDMQWKNIQANVKPVFAEHLTTQHANANKGNETGWAANWEINRPKSSDYGYTGLPVDLLDDSLEQRYIALIIFAALVCSFSTIA